MKHAILLLILITVPDARAMAQSQWLVFRGATVHPVAAPPVVNAAIVVGDGLVREIGPADQISSPPGAQEIDLSGKVVIPGLVDTHSHIGRVEGGDGTGAFHPGIRTLDAINIRHSSIERARAGGITTVNIMSGSGHLMSGQTSYLKLRRGNSIEDLLFCEDPIRDICGGMKMANGTNPIRQEPGSFPGTRARSAAMARKQFVDAIAYRDNLTRAGDDVSKRPDRDLEKEALVEVLEGRRIVHFHVHRHDDILTALRLRDEFGFRMVLHHLSEAWKVAEEIARAGVPASIIVLDSPGGKLEAVDIRLENGAVLANAGVDVAYHTDDYITDSRLFLRSAALGIRAGLTREKALEALTLAGARMLDLSDRIGSLETGKDADFVVLTGDPFSVYTRVEQTWIEGVKVFDLNDPDHRRYAVGDFDVMDAQEAAHVD